MTSGIVSSSSLPDSPSRRDGVGRGVPVADCSSVTDTISAFDASISLRMRLAPATVKLRIANVCQCGEFEVPISFEARSSQELQIQNRTRNHRVASAPLIPKFASEVPRILANFGIGALVPSSNAQPCELPPSY